MGLGAAARNARLLRTSLSPSPSSQYRKQISVANLFQRYGFPSTQLHSFLSDNRFLLDSHLPDLQKSLDTLFSFRIPQKTLISLLRDCPGVLEHRFLHNWKSAFSELNSLVPNSSPLMLANLLQCCTRFQIDPVEFSHRVEVFKGLGFSDAAVARVLEGFPGVIVMSEREIVCVIEFLVDFGVTRDEVDRIVQLNPRVLGFGVEDRLKPLIEELRGLGFSRREVRKEIVREPRILGMETGEFSRCLKLLESLKCREAIREKILEEGMLRACFEVKLRVDCLCGHGLIRRDALKVLWKEPRLITYDLDDIVKKIEFLVHRMKYGVDCLPDVPEYLGVNFDKQIVPRYNVVEYLRAKGAIGFEVGLKDLIKPTRLRFYNLYVKPYPECEKIYGRFSRNLEVKSKHPAGLWKIFQPQKFPSTDEDVKNMKSFMDSMV
ncbi:transcription termination factor MTERF15, mitochondrial [Lotus japonicus]|uniref:transcription termination factor MTERF15, mitochondrial n=1 Tax=Lotus japonicus TaxID=34305 RepID=UPI002584D1A1|nr:transcription termination factor MTERF15, mitochondrial [Lotus japonicus]